MKAFDSLAVTCYVDYGTSRVEVDTLEWMGKEKDPSVIGGNIRSYDNTSIGAYSSYSNDSQFVGIVDGVEVKVIAGGAWWPISSNDTNLYIGQTEQAPTRSCSVIGLGDDISLKTSPETEYISDNFIIWPARKGGCVYYEQDSTTSFGLASGIYSPDVSMPRYYGYGILDKTYWLPLGGGGGGGDSAPYSVNYNTTVIPAQIASKSLGGSGMLGGGFGNIINNEGRPRTVDAWMPGAGGGGAFQDNRNGEFTNGYGGQGVMICWIKY